MANNNSLKHYGIPGMRWGVQNGPPYPLTNATKSASEKREISPEYKKAHAGTPAKYLSTKELSEINNRLNQERMYNEYLRNQRLGRRIINSWKKVVQKDTKVFNDVVRVGNTEFIQGALRASGQKATADVLKVFNVLVPKKK